MSETPKPRVAITYCTQCHWLLRAAWMAQELLQTFGTSLGEVALVPSTGGAFAITLDGAPIWERKADGGFPDVKVLKQRLRDVLDPGRDLGHLDRDVRKLAVDRNAVLEPIVDGGANEVLLP